jgi:hypothetical protein
MTTLFINRFDSICGACNKAADPYEKAHTTRLGYGDDKTGCGAVFTAVSSNYAGVGERIKNMRPDLPYEGM